MQKYIKYSVITLCALFLIAVIAITLLVNLVNPNHFKDQISKQVYSHTGRALTINGDISWTLFPWLGVQVENAQLSNVAGFGEQPFAVVRKAKVSLRLLPLLVGKIVVGDVSLQGLELHLIKNKAGVTNWQDLTSPTQAASSENRTEQTAAKSKYNKLASYAIDISSIDVVNSQITWRNQQKNQAVDISDIAFQSNSIALNKEFPVTLSAKVRTSAAAEPMTIKLTSHVNLDVAQQNYNFKKLELTTELPGKAYPDGKLAVNLQANVATQLQAHTVAIEGIRLKVANVEVTGNLQGSNRDSELDLNGKLQAASFNLRKLLQALGKNIDTKDGRALKNTMFSAQAHLTNEALQLTQVQLTVDDTKLHGNMAMTDFANPAFRYDLAADQIDVNRYMSGKSDNSKDEAKVATASGAKEDDASVTALQNLAVQGRLQVGKVTVGKMILLNNVITLDAKKGVIKFDPIVAQVYGGKYHGIISIDARGARPMLTMKHSLSGMQAEPLMDALSDTTHVRMSGIANIDTQLTATGLNGESIKRTLSGNGKFAFNNGVLKGIDLEHYITMGLALYKKQPELQTPNTKQTPFGNLTGTFTVTNGVAQNQDLLMRSNKLQAKGNGKADLVNQQLDMHIEASLLNPTTQQPQGTTIPISVSGPFNKVTIKPDVAAIMKSQVGKQLDRLKSKVSDQLEEKVGKELGDKLKSLFQ